MARILVVDDESSIIELLKYNLRLDGHEVDGVQTGEEALEAIEMPNWPTKNRPRETRAGNHEHHKAS